MRTEIEITRTAANMSLQQGVEAVATELLGIEDDDTTRASVAEIVRRHGFAAYIGGRHVAIHQADDRGAIQGDRLAIVTHGGNDWL